jgi:hypothetical protein
VSTRFEHLPDEPQQPETKQAYKILASAHASSSSFLDAFDAAASGEETDTQQDLLRAMLVFASAGLDSMAKQLIKDALAQVIQLRPGARENLRTFVERRLAREESADKLLAVALTSPDPRGELIASLIDELGAGSLQSAEELSKLAAYFDIPTAELIGDHGLLAEIFRVRNQITHELDVDFAQEGRHRRHRDRDTMCRYTTELLRVAGVLLDAVERRV